MYYGEDFLYYGEDFLYYGEDFLYYGEDFSYCVQPRGAGIQKIRRLRVSSALAPR